LQDRFAGLSGPGSFRGGGLRGGIRGLRGGGFRGGGLRGGFRGGFGGQAGAGRDFSNQDLYADYSGPDQQAATPTGPGGLRMDGHGYNAGFGAGAGAGFGAAYTEPEPSQQIMVRNVRGSFLLPTRRSRDRLAAVVDCQRGFGRIIRDYWASRACGDFIRWHKVQRMRCCPICPSDGSRNRYWYVSVLITCCRQSQTPTLVIAKFQQYMYGGRPLGKQLITLFDNV